MQTGFPRFLLRRALLGIALVLLVSSAAFVLAKLAPGDHVPQFGMDPAEIAAERERLGLDRPLGEQFGRWFFRSLRLDFGESVLFRRPVGGLVREAAFNTALLGLCALFLATATGIPLGIYTGSHRRGTLARLARATSVVLISLPPLITSIAFMLLAARTGWFPLGGIGPSGGGTAIDLADRLHYLILPTLALALPIAATLERLQSRALSEALEEPCISAALARGIPRERAVWRHGLRLSLKPVLAVYGIMIGSLLSGSFAVELVMSWPGLGQLLYRAFVFRDTYLIAGCAVAASLFLAVGILLSDLALAAADPRLEEQA